MKRFRILVVLVLLALVCAEAATVAYPNRVRRKPVARPEGVFRLMTFNVNVTGVGEVPKAWMDSLFAVISEVQPDVLCLQEMSPSRVQYVKAGLDSLFGYSSEQKIDLAMQCYIYSRLPFRNFRGYEAQGDIDTTGFSPGNMWELFRLRGGLPMYSLDVTLPDGRETTVFSCHLRSAGYSTARRSMKPGSSWLSGLSLYKNEYFIGKRIRDFEADNLRAAIDRHHAEGRSVIVAGDLNDWNTSYTLKKIQGSDLRDAWLTKGTGAGYTYDGWGLRLRLDHILYPSSFDLLGVYVLDQDLSDHRALVADFRLK